MSSDIEIEEYTKCKNDPVYFIENYFYYYDYNQGESLLELRQDQKEYINLVINASNPIIAKTYRQSGKTLINSAYALWYSIFNDNKTILLASFKIVHTNHQNILIRFAYDKLPDFLKPKKVVWNKRVIEFDNCSKIFVAIINDYTLRGRSSDLVIIDDFSYATDKNKEEFWASVPPSIVTTKGKIIITSGTNGKDLFYELWMKSGSWFTKFESKWYENVDNPERFKSEMIKILGMDIWNREYECEFLS